MKDFTWAWCRGHGDKFRTIEGSTSQKEQLCAACAIRNEEETRLQEIRRLENAKTRARKLAYDRAKAKRKKND